MPADERSYYHFTFLHMHHCQLHHNKFYIKLSALVIAIRFQIGNLQVAMSFKLHTSYSAAGDQPEAIRQLTDGVLNGERYQTLLGVTGSGKTFTIANVIQEIQRPTLVLTHNKTLVAQLYGEFRQFFPENAVEYFVSYYDYYQPEAYMPVSDVYIEKDLSINEELDKLRLRATTSC